MKKIYLLFIIFFTQVNLLLAADIKDAMIPTWTTVLWTTWEWYDPLNSVIVYVKNFIFNFLWLLVVWIFIYFWYRMVTSKWNPEELKKTMMWFVYVVVWLAIISLAWGAVKLATTLNF
jgi:hypothetical protein